MKSSQIANSQISSFQDILLVFPQGSSYSYYHLRSHRTSWILIKHMLVCQTLHKSEFFPKTFYLFQDNHLHFYLFPCCCFYLNQLYRGIIYIQQDAYILVDSWMSFDKYLHLYNHHQNQDIEQICHVRKFHCAWSRSVSTLAPGNHLSVFCHEGLILLQYKKLKRRHSFMSGSFHSA